MRFDDFNGVIFVLIGTYILGALTGISADSDRDFLAIRLEWADSVCLPHGGADRIDTSSLFSSREVTCKDGTEIFRDGLDDIMSSGR